MNVIKRSACIVLLAAISPLGAAIVWAQVTIKPAPSAQSNTPVASNTWDNGDAPRIAVPRNAPVTFGPGNCPIVVVGKEAWSLTAGKKISNLEWDYDRSAIRALSADGKWFAATVKGHNQDGTGVLLWSTESGENVLQVPGEKGRFVDFVALAGKLLLLGGRDRESIEVWDASTAKKIKILKVARVSTEKTAVSPDGAFLVTQSSDERSWEVFSISTGGRVAVMAQPPARPRVSRTPPSGTQPLRKTPRTTDDDSGIEAIFVNAWLHGLAFSPDSTELAMVSTHPVPHLVVWNNHGTVVLDLDVPACRIGPCESPLVWLPDGSGWLLDGSVLVDRKSKRELWKKPTRFGQDPVIHFVSRDQFLSAGETMLDATVIPWEQINKSVTAMLGKDPAYVRPGDTVSIEVEIDATRGDAGKVRDTLGAAMTARLAEAGLKVADGHDVMLLLTWREAAGKTKKIVERTSPFDLRGRDTGRTATETNGQMTVELWANGMNQPIWSQQLTGRSATSFEKDINDAVLRESMIEDIRRQLATMELPYFVPRDDSLEMLPMIGTRAGTR